MAADSQGWAMTLTAEKEGQATSFLLHQDVSRNLSEYLNFIVNYHCILIVLNTLFKLAWLLKTNRMYTFYAVTAFILTWDWIHWVNLSSLVKLLFAFSWRMCSFLGSPEF